MKKNYFFRMCSLALLLLSLFKLNAQQWEGLSVYSLSGGTTACLMDTNGTVVKTWTLNSPTRYSQYLLPGGTLIRTAGTGFSITPTHGGMYTRVQKIDFNGNLLWDWSLNTPTYCLHHDIAPMPNGNVLVTVAVKISPTDYTLAGGTTNTASTGYLSEEVWEVEPIGTNSVNVVWKWKMWDHLVQNLYPAQANYQPSIVTHPELININYNVQADLMHMNGIDYNPVLDQIALSSRYKDEIYIIDHSTTIAEAASHSGGKAGKGGDILYRWGNPAAYQAVGPKILDAPHDSHWVPEGGKDAGMFVGLNISGVTTPSARTCVDKVYTPRVNYTYTINIGSAFTPTQVSKRYMSPVQIAGYSNSVQFRNGNMQMCFTTGNIWEVDTNGTTIFTKYIGPGFSPQSHRYPTCYVMNPPSPQPSVTISGPIIMTGTAPQYQWYMNGNAIPTATNQFYFPQSNGYYMVRVMDANNCEWLYSSTIYFTMPPPPPPPTAIQNISKELSQLMIYPNPTNGYLNIDLPGMEKYTVLIHNLSGELVLKSENEPKFDLSALSEGLYLCKVQTTSGSITRKITVIK